MTIDDLFSLPSGRFRLTIEPITDRNGKPRFVASVDLDGGGYLALGDTPAQALANLLSTAEVCILADRAEKKTECDHCGACLGRERFYDKRDGAFCSKSHRDASVRARRLARAVAEAAPTT